MFKSFSKTKLLLKKPKQERNGDSEGKSRTSMSSMSTPSPSLLRRATGMANISSMPKAVLQTPKNESPKRQPAILTVESEPKRIKLEDAIRDKTKCLISDSEGKEKQCNRSYGSKAAEGTGPQPLCNKYGRHIVSAVNRQSSETRLILKCGNSETVCVLRDSWARHAIENVNTGDVVNVIQAKEGALEKEVIIDDSAGLLVVNPDRLISGTSVVATLFCQRKAILNDLFRGLEGPSKSMFVGTLVHELLQTCVKSRIADLADVKAKFESILSQTSNLNDMMLLNVSKNELLKEVEPFLPHVIYFIKHYVLGSDLGAPPGPAFATSQGASTLGAQGGAWKGRVVDVVDVEENIWSPRLGMKGKVDLTVSAQLPSGLMTTVPLELKTGRASGSAEHKGQVIIYSMMMGERRNDPELGLLLYLRNSMVQEVKAGIHEMRGLVQLRNEAVRYLAAKAVREEVSEGIDSYSQAELPSPIEARRICAGCPQLLVCSMYQKISQDSTLHGTHPMAELVPQAVNHLSQKHEEFFEKWSLMMALESEKSEEDNKLKKLWCMTPLQRESEGMAITNLSLTRRDIKSEESYVHAFTRNGGNITLGTFKTGDTVTLSTDKELALSQGVVIEVSNDKIAIALDRDLHSLGEDFTEKRVYHIDQYQYQGTSSSLMVNLAKLMSDNLKAEELRALIIDKIQVSFLKGLSKEVIPAGKHILRSLNSVQQKAIFKTLMAEQYVLLQGLPGTGKTTLIVALVRLLVSMKKTVLLTAYTHSALDNILLKILAHGDDNLVRIGKISRVHPSVRQFSVDAIAKSKNVDELRKRYESFSVVATTCLSLSHPAIASRNFDYCIVDEAGQAPLLSAIGPLFHAKKFVLVGDPKQLPPVVQSDRARKLGLDTSLFYHLTTEFNTIRLNLQYRMNSQIMGLANKLVYENQLKCGSDEVRDRRIKTSSNLPSPGFMARVLSNDMCDSIVFLDTSYLKLRDFSGEGVIRNSMEAMIVAKIASVLKSSAPEISLGIMAPYRAQVDLLSSKLTLGPAVVNTVDQFQGRDRDVILYSCTRSTESKSDSSKDILHDIRRLNVAITRARMKLVFIGNRKVLTRRYEATFQKLCGHLDPNAFYELSSADIE